MSHSASLLLWLALCEQAQLERGSSLACNAAHPYCITFAALKLLEVAVLHTLMHFHDAFSLPKQNSHSLCMIYLLAYALVASMPLQYYTATLLDAGTVVWLMAVHS